MGVPARQPQSPGPAEKTLTAYLATAGPTARMDGLLLVNDPNTSIRAETPAELGVVALQRVVNIDTVIIAGPFVSMLRDSLINLRPDNPTSHNSTHLPTRTPIIMKDDRFRLIGKDDAAARYVLNILV